MLAHDTAGPPLAESGGVDRAVIATAYELFEARHYPSVIALISDALEEEPEHVPLLVLRARANIALRRDLEAQADLRDIIRLDPQCGTAYRLLGQLAARRDENESAAIFFREALRLDPGDREASEWLQILGATSRPAAVANKLPAPAAAAGRFPRARTGGDARSLSAPVRAERAGSHARFAKGTQAPDDERPTARKGEGPTLRLGSADGLRPKYAAGAWNIDVSNNDSITTPDNARPARNDSIASLASAGGGIRAVRELPLPAPNEPKQEPIRTLTGRPSRPMTRTALPELPGFGEYLVDSGILTRERLRAAQAYQRSMKVQLSTAIVTLGLATPQRIEWAVVAHQSHVGRDR
jgi:hypothetical protein